MRPSAQAFAADSCSDLLVFPLDMNNAPFVIDSVFISLSLIKGAYHFGMVDVVFLWAYFATGPIFSDSYFYMAHGSLGSQWKNIACYGAPVCRHERASRSAHVDVIIRAPEAAVDCHFRNEFRQTGLDA